MKKLTKLHILMLMSLAIGSSHVYTNDAAQMLDAAERAEDLNDDVLNELEKSDDGRKVINQIVLDEADLKAQFNKILQFVHEKNKEIARLSQAAEVAEMDIARLAVELADAQAKFKQAQALRAAKNKNESKIETTITSDLDKAIMALKALNKNATKTFQSTGKKMQKAVSDVKNSRAYKTVTKSSAQAANKVNEAADQTVDYVHSQLFPRSTQAQARPFMGEERVQVEEPTFMETEFVQEEPAEIAIQSTEVITQSYDDMNTDDNMMMKDQMPEELITQSSDTNMIGQDEDSSEELITQNSDSCSPLGCYPL